MNSITYGESNVAIVCLPGSSLPELAFALEFASNNFCGRGIYRWDVERERGESGACIVNLVSLMPDNKPRPLKISQVAQLGGAVQQGIIPATLPLKESFRFDKESPRLAKDGQHRQRKLFSFVSPDVGWAESIIESHDIDPHQTLSTYSFGFADMVVGLFALGVKNLKYQMTRGTTQLYIKHKLTDEQLIRYFQANGNDYPIGWTVEKLP
jgi:hypothetical protein